MKMALLNVLLGMVLAGYPVYAQTGMRGGSAGNGPAGSGNGNGFVEHAAPASSHGQPGPHMNAPGERHVGDGHGSEHSRPDGDRFSGERRGFDRREGFGDRRIFRGGLFDRGFGRGRGVVVFAYGVPYYYPAYYPDSGSYDSTPTYAPDSSTATEYTTDPDTQTQQYVNQDTDSYYQPGYQWGGEMKLYHVTMDQFVAYLKAYILTASPVQQAAFRSGFVAHFGTDGQALYDQAVQQAIPQN